MYLLFAELIQKLYIVSTVRWRCIIFLRVCLELEAAQ